MQELKSFEDGRASEAAECASGVRAANDTHLLLAEELLRGWAVVERGPRTAADGVELMLGSEVLLPGLLGEAATIGAGGDLRLQELGQAADVLLRNAQEKGVPVGSWGEKVVVRDQYGSDAGAHDLKEADAAGACSSGTEDEMGGGEELGVTMLPVLASGLVEIPVEVGAGVFDEDIGSMEVEVEEPLAKERGAATLKREEQGLCGEQPPSADEGVGVLPVAGDVGVAEGATGATVLVLLGGAVDARSERQVVVIFRVDGAEIGKAEIEGMTQEEIRIAPKAAGEEDEVCAGRVTDKRVFAVLCPITKQVDQFALVEGGQVDVHG